MCEVCPETMGPLEGVCMVCPQDCCPLALAFVLGTFFGILLFIVVLIVVAITCCIVMVSEPSLPCVILSCMLFPVQCVCLHKRRRMKDESWVISYNDIKISNYG